MSKNLSEEQLKDIQDTFNMFDKDKNGSVSTKEIGIMVKSLNQKATEVEIQDMINEMDADGNGLISLEEFTSAMIKKMKDVDNEEELADAFKVMDTDNNGLVSFTDVKAIFLELEEDVSDEDIKSMINMCKPDKDGFIKFEDLSKLILN